MQFGIFPILQQCNMGLTILPHSIMGKPTFNAGEESTTDLFGGGVIINVNFLRFDLNCLKK
jgi:hypothetical protein